MGFARGAGVLLSVTSLPSAYGIGTLGYEAYRFVDTLFNMKQRYWQVLPLGPTSYGDSPYQAFSAFAGNPYLIDLDMLIKDELLTYEEVHSFNWGESEKDVDYGVLFENRYKVLRMAFARFDTRNKEFIQFYNKNIFWIEDYSLFMALKEKNGNSSWITWEEALRDREAEAIKMAKKELEEQILFWEFCQFKFYEQWKQLKEYANQHSVEIIGDVPLYVALDSADVWAHAEEFQLNADKTPSLVSGCPPDVFSITGQRWGNPLFDWDVMEANDFSWWRARVRSSAVLFDIIRLDHFVGMVRYYSIPEEETDGRNGIWRKAPGKKLTEAIKAELGEKGKVIVEDFGASIPGVGKLSKKNGWPGMEILLFAFGEDSDHGSLPHNYQDTNRVVYAGTHDNATIVGYFKEKSEEELEYLYDYLNIHSKEEIPDALIRLAYSSVADIVILQLQDILKLDNEARMNLPSTVGRNWRWRLWNDAITEERMEFIRKMTTLYRR